MSKPGLGRAEACANIALAKYWGKSERGDNLTAVPSLSLTLDALRTRTEVRFDDEAKEDSLVLGNENVEGRPLLRVSELLDRFRHLSGENRRATVTSENNFPTAAGLASSASGFAALSVAAGMASGLNTGLNERVGMLSSQARKSSASAARSLFEGFATLGANEDEGMGFLPANHWDVAMVVAVIASGPKSVGSTGGMVHTKATSPYYSAWETSAPRVYEEVKSGVLRRDFAQVAESMEHSTRLMHATMLTSVPPVVYLKGPTIELMHAISAQRAGGQPVAYTMDAGPNVKVFTLGSHVEKVVSFLQDFSGVESTIVCRPGPAASTLSLEGSLSAAVRDDRYES